MEIVTVISGNQTMSDHDTAVRAAISQGWVVVSSGAWDDGDATGVTTTFKKMPVLLVGRHTTGDVAPGLEVVRQENVNFVLSVKGCLAQINDLMHLATEANALGVIFQNTPGIVTAALLHSSCSYSDEWQAISTPSMNVGVIISRPGPRTSGVEQTMVIPFQCGSKEAQDFVTLVKHANGRARVENNEYDGHSSIVSVTVDPVAPFEFDHIEWL